MKKNITTTMFIWILCCTLLAFVIFNTANYYFLSQSYFERINRENQIHTGNVALGVSSFYETVYRVVGEMAQAQEAKSTDAAEQQAFIRDRFSQHGFFDNLVIQRVPDGVQTARVRGEKATRPDRWWFRRVMEGKRPIVSPAFYSFGFDSNAPTPTTGVFFPVMQGDKMVSQFAAFVRMDEVQSRVARHYRGDDRYTYILDAEGVVIAHPDWDQVRQQHNYKNATRTSVVRDKQGEVLLDGNDYWLQYEPFNMAPDLQRIVSRALAGESGTAEYTELDGKIMFCSFAPVPVPGYGAAWAAITVQDKNLALAPLQQATGRNAALSFIVLAGLAVVIIRQSRARELGSQQLAETNLALEEEVHERVRAEEELTAANEELTAMNEEMIAVTEELQHTNQQIMTEVEVRQAAETKVRLRERQYHAMTRLIADNNAEFGIQMQSMLDSALELVESSDGYIALLEDGKMIVRYARGIREAFLGRNVTEEPGLMSIVLETGRLKYVEDYQNYPCRWQGQVWEKQSTAVILPLKREEKVVGALSIAWKDTIHSLLTEELEMLQQFADLAALALQGAKLREELSYTAYHDSLTGLPNRAFLIEHLETELAAAALTEDEVAVFYIDLDDLKSINDNFGHSSGDILIESSAARIRAITDEQTFIARLGGDEFIVVLSGQRELNEVVRIGDLLVEGLCREYQIANDTARVSASVGIARYPQDGASAGELMQKADNAMYAAKTAGRNCWRFFDPVMLRDAQEKMLLTNSLRRALERDELQIVYQPQVEMRDGKVVGFEALLRWHSKEHGIVPPDRFIPLAEHTKLILPIGMWALRQACSFARRLALLGHPEVRVAVNISPKQLADENLIEDIGRLLEASKIAPQQLELEITESALLASLEDSGRKLQQLDALGVLLALDDFGTGYSSLTHLRLFPVETLKIDKSFIDHLPERETVLVKSLIHFAQSLNIKVVAEGVERREQWEYLRSCGCDYVQGYFASRPIAEEDAVRFLSEKNLIGESAG